MFIFLSVSLILFVSTDCRQFDSIVVKNLYQKFITLTKNETEIKVLNELNEINELIVGFDHHFKSQTNGTELDPKVVEQILFGFVIKAVQKILNSVDIRDILYGVNEGVSTSSICLACHLLTAFIFNTRIPVNVVLKVISFFCGVLNIPNFSTNVCKGNAIRFKEPLNYIRHNRHLKRSEICGIILGVQCFMKSGTCFNNASPPSDKLCWILQLNQKNLSVNTKPKTEPNDRIYRTLHLTDIHVDTEYVPLTTQNCGQPYCCRPDFQSENNSEESPDAGVWGSYHCDLPIQTVVNLFETIDWQSIDLVYWTGDVSSHDVWANTWKRTIDSSRLISQLLKTYSQSPVVSTLGNHISIPCGTFSPPNIQGNLSARPLYRELAEEWSQWLNKEESSTFLRAGYYMKRIRPGFRIIVMNTNYCARLNIWTLYNSIDPADHLKWLIDQLDSAEKEGDSVHIVGHIPPDNRECTQSWLYNYMAIVERYSDTIVGQFFGHTHRDEFRVLHSNNDCNKPIGFEILSPSVTPYTSPIEPILNPAFRIISTMYHGQIKDMETFTFDLSQANSVPGAKPEWIREYSMAEDYSIWFNSHEFHQFLRTLIRDNYYLQLFYLHYTRSQRNDYCNNDCKTKIISDSNVCNAFHSIPKPISIG